MAQEVRRGSRSGIRKELQNIETISTGGKCQNISKGTEGEKSGVKWNTVITIARFKRQKE